MTTNFLVLLPILKFPVLRREKSYLIIAALTFIDLVNGLACLTAGIIRNYLIVINRANRYISK